MLFTIPIGNFIQISKTFSTEMEINVIQTDIVSEIKKLSPTLALEKIMKFPENHRRWPKGENFIKVFSVADRQLRNSILSNFVGSCSDTLINPKRKRVRFLCGIPLKVRFAEPFLYKRLKPQLLPHVYLFNVFHGIFSEHQYERGLKGI